MTDYVFNQTVEGKLKNPLFYYDCSFAPGAIINNGVIIKPTSKLKNITLNNCFVDEAIIEGTKIRGNLSAVRSLLFNCNIQNVENPSFNDCVVEYKGRHEYSLPILDGTFTDCVIKKCKLIEPDIRKSITMIDSSLVYDENTLI